MPSSLSREQLLRQRSSARVYQERADATFAAWDLRAAAPVIDEDIGDYRRKLAIQAKRLLPDDHELRQVQVKRMPDDAFEVFEPQIYQACRASAFQPSAIPRGQIERRVQVDSNGQKIVHWLGQESFVKDFPLNRRGRRVTSFRVDGHYLDGSGRPLR